MGEGFEAYIEILELIAFFAGYPLLFTLVHFLAEQKKYRSFFFKRSMLLLPYSYALATSLYLGLAAKNIYLEYEVTGVFVPYINPYLKAWATLGLLFWLPYFNRKRSFSLIHSLVFFFLLLKDVYLYAAGNLGKPALINDMKLYSDSLLLHSGCLGLVYLWWLATRYLRCTKHNRHSMTPAQKA